MKSGFAKILISSLLCAVICVGAASCDSKGDSVSPSDLGTVSSEATQEKLSELETLVQDDEFQEQVKALSQTYESKGEVLSFVREKMAEGGFTSLLEWMNKWESADGKKDAEDLLSEEFEYVCQRSMTSTSSSLWKDSATSLGTIVREPDADGFFVMRPRYEDEDHLCVLLRKKESPSLYRGMLV